MKTYSVSYSVTTVYEAIVKAKTAKEAQQKVKEVIGDPISVEQTYEVKN